MTEIKPHAAHWGYLRVMGHGQGEAGTAQGRWVVRRYADRSSQAAASGKAARAPSRGQG
jgi:hypothetical protein